VDKLCQRFRLSEDPRQWRDIAFCLSLLPFKSERSVKKLIEGLQFYRDKLHEEAVYTRFTEILAKVILPGVQLVSMFTLSVRLGQINQLPSRIQSLTNLNQ
jgi:condensin complex subunit 1